MSFLKPIQRGMQGICKLPNYSFQPFQQQAFYPHWNTPKRFSQGFGSVHKAYQPFSLFSSRDNSSDKKKKEKAIEDNDQPKYIYQYYLNHRQNNISKSQRNWLIINIDVNKARHIGIYIDKDNPLNNREDYVYSESIEELIDKGIIKARVITPQDEIHEQFILDPETIPDYLENKLTIEGEYEYIYDSGRGKEVINSYKNLDMFASIDRSAGYELGSSLQRIEQRSFGYNLGSIRRYYSGCYKDAIDKKIITGHMMEELDEVIRHRDIIDLDIIPPYYQLILFGKTGLIDDYQATFSAMP